MATDSFDDQQEALTEKCFWGDLLNIERSWSKRQQTNQKDMCHCYLTRWKTPLLIQNKINSYIGSPQSSLLLCSSCEMRDYYLCLKFSFTTIVKLAALYHSCFICTYRCNILKCFAFSHASKAEFINKYFPEPFPFSTLETMETLPTVPFFKPLQYWTHKQEEL